MPPPFALLLCVIFVVFLLRLDYKQSSEVSFFLWVPSIWALVTFSRPLDIWFGQNELGTMESGSTLDRAFLIVLFCFAVFILLKRKFDWSSAIRNNSWLLFLVGFMLISIMWSSIPYISFKRWTREFIAVIMAFVLLSERNPRQALLSILRRVSYILIPFSALLIKYYPVYGIEFDRWSGERMWIGVATQKNGLARVSIISVLFLVWTLVRGWRGRDIPVVKYQTYLEVLLILLALLLLMGPRRTLTYSATSTVGLTIAMLTLYGLYWMRKRGSEFSAIALKTIILIIIVYGTIAPFIGKLPILDISSVVGREGTLTGRADGIWKVLVPLALNRPILGHGYGGFWTTEMRILTSSHAHNGYLDVILNIGFLGLLLVSVFWLSCCRKAHRAITDNFEWGVLFICYLIMAVVFNITESSIDSLSASFPAIVMFFSVSSMKVSGEQNRIQSRS